MKLLYEKNSSQAYLLEFTLARIEKLKGIVIEIKPSFYVEFLFKELT